MRAFWLKWLEFIVHKHFYYVIISLIKRVKTMEKKQDKSKSGISGMLIPVLAIVTLIGIGLAFFFYTRYTDIRDNPTGEIEARNQEESARITGALQEIIVFNEEDPTVARIEDPSALQLSNPDFYADAQPGDYLVLFPSTAIIYREVDDRIINVAPIIHTQGLTQDGVSTDDTADDTDAVDQGAESAN